MGVSLLLNGSFSLTMKITTNIVIINGIVANRDLNPTIMNKLQMTSAKMTKIKLKVTPRPIGSANCISPFSKYLNSRPLRTNK